MVKMEKRIIKTEKAPAAIGPYSQAIVIGELLYTSGQIAIDPVTNVFNNGNVEQQTVQVMQNLTAILEEADCTLEDVVKTTIFLKDMKDFGTVNEIYARYFGNSLPARSCVQAAEIPKDALIEIELIAVVGG